LFSQLVQRFAEPLESSAKDFRFAAHCFLTISTRAEIALATLTGFEPSLVISRYCAILPQIRGELRII